MLQSMQSATDSGSEVHSYVRGALTPTLDSDAYGCVDSFPRSLVTIASLQFCYTCNKTDIV